MTNWVRTHPSVFSEDKKTDPMRRTNLQLKVGYGRSFGKHNINSILVYNQQKTTSGSSIPQARDGYAHPRGIWLC